MSDRVLPSARATGLAVVVAVVLSAFISISDSLAAGKAFELHATPKDLPEILFQNAQGEQLSLSNFRGRLVLLNIWATWCAPCREEMPTLDRLQGELGGPDFKVIALSIDRAGAAPVQKFFEETKIENLEAFIDQPAASMRGLTIFGLPSTLLLDRQGREVGRLVGPAEWDTPQMLIFFRNLITNSTDTTASKDQTQEQQE